MRQHFEVKTRSLDESMKKNQWIFLWLMFSIVSYLGYRNPLYFDTTFNHHNSLQESSKEILQAITSPVQIELYTEDPITREHVTDIISLFREESAQIQWKEMRGFMDPDKKWRLGLKGNHHLLIRYQDTFKAVDIQVEKWNEHTFSQLLYQITHAEKRWVVFLRGHGEPNLSETGNRHLSTLAENLKEQGLALASINLQETKIIPDNTALLIIDDLKAPLLPQETSAILEYLKQGKSLLWAANPHAVAIPELADALGIHWLNGTLEDTEAKSKGAPHPAIHLVTEYPKHPVTETLAMLTVFPWTKAFLYQQASTLGWEAKPFLNTSASSILVHQAQYQNGPFTLGVSLAKQNQRIVVLGNTHFLSNAGIESYGNSTLIQHIIHWLIGEDLLLTEVITPIPDANFTPNLFTQTLFTYVFPYVLPLGFFLLGWRLKQLRYRRHRCL
jgi:hypothetical protein